MKHLFDSTRKTAASLASMALLIGVSSASAGLTVTVNNQSGSLNTWPFTPTWTPASGSLIAGLAPSTAVGNFSQEIAGRHVESLTIPGISLTLDKVAGTSGTTTSTNYVTCGSGAGSVLVYSLPASANGYNLTNITVFGGWADQGRDALRYTVLYSTVDNPGNFKYLATVNYNPSVADNTPTANRATIDDSAGGVIAANVAAVKFVFTTPGAENGFAGYAAITVQGTAASGLLTPVVSITTSNETGANPYLPTWTMESPNLLSGLAPIIAVGNFTQETAGGTPVLTDGVPGFSGDVNYFATCGTGGGGTLIYSLPNVVNGSDITNIVVYSGWGDGGRDGQYYTVSYSTIAAPTTYVPITTVFYDPAGTSGAVANRVAIGMNNGTPLASGVANIKFDFSTPPSANQFDNGYQGYAEIIVQGGDTATPPPPPSPYLTEETLPGYAETVVGDQVVFRAAFSNAPPANLQWQCLNAAGTVTNDIPGATASTLTLNNVQLTDAGFYRLKAVNATNGAAAPSYSTARQLVVGPVPAAVNNVIVQCAGQSGLGAMGTSTNFYPTWTMDTTGDLVLGFPVDGSGSLGTATAGPGNYGLDQCSGDPAMLVDGTFGYLNHWPNVGGSPSLVTCGSSAQGPGASMTFTLKTGAAPKGFDLTNIVVYGGWGDSGRDEQKFEVKYSTVAAPTTFNSILTVDYNPANPLGAQSATRTTLVPATGVLAENVYAVQINWALQGAPPENGYEGYSEIIIKGTPSADKPVLTQDITPHTAEDVEGSQLTLTAAFSGATSYQWQKNGTNIPGANSTTLTLSPLQVGDTATNGGYRLTASNGAGTSVTRGCAVMVHPAPVAVGNVKTAFAFQTSDAGSFTPTWDTSDFFSSLLAFAYPSSFGTGNFNDPDPNPISSNLAGGLPMLTDGGYGAIVDGGAHPAFATCGPNAGQFVVYTLSANANGYDLTNILVASGWNDGGRNANWATVLYSTVANPSTFIPLAILTNRPVVTEKSAIRATITPAAGLLASNVYAIKVDFTTPPGIPNGYSGFSQINVFGSPSAHPAPGPVVATENQNTDIPSWTPETPSLIAGQLPSSVGLGDNNAGSFTLEGTGGLVELTDGVIGTSPEFAATCGGAGGGGGTFVTYTAAQGWILTNIVVYTGWKDFGRDGQFYNVSYASVAAPNTFVPLATVAYNPDTFGGATANRVVIAPPVGQTTLASNVVAVKFDFTPQGNQDYGYSAYTEIILQGSNLSVPTPPIVGAPTVSGGNLIFTGTGGTPNRAYSLVTATSLLTPPAEWTVITTGVLNGSGAFSNAVPVDPATPVRFFRLQIPW